MKLSDLRFAEIEKELEEHTIYIEEDVLAPLEIEKRMREMSQVRKLGKPMYMVFSIYKQGRGEICKGLAVPADALDPDGTPTYRNLLSAFYDKWVADKCERFEICVRLAEMTDRNSETEREYFYIKRNGGGTV